MEFRFCDPKKKSPLWQSRVTKNTPSELYLTRSHRTTYTFYIFIWKLKLLHEMNQHNYLFIWFIFHFGLALLTWCLFVFNSWNIQRISGFVQLPKNILFLFFLLVVVVGGGRSNLWVVLFLNLCDVFFQSNGISKASSNIVHCHNDIVNSIVKLIQNPNFLISTTFNEKKKGIICSSNQFSQHSVNRQWARVFDFDCLILTG